MLHLYKYRFICMIRNRSMIFWTLAFPFILTTLFSLVLTNVYTFDSFKTIPIAVIANDSYQQNESLKIALKSVSKDKQALFAIKEVDNESEARTLLDDEKVDAYVEVGSTYSIKVAENGINQTVVETFFNEYKQKESMFKRIIQQGSSLNEVQHVLSETTSYIDQKTVDNANVISVFFFTVLAMDAMFGGYWSIRSTYELQANQSSHAARFAVAPIPKGRSLFVDFTLNMIFQMFFLFILFGYMNYVLEIEFGAHFFELIIALIIGTFAGNGLGVLIGTHVVKLPIDGKINVLTSVTMLCSFLAGMMMVQMKYIIQVYAPFINYVNPVNMITDALYSLYYYGVNERYYMNIISLLVFAFICYGLSFIALRKKAYDSLEVR